MTSKEIIWLKTGKVGDCLKCPFRKPIDEMNTELLPCNQYQCLVKLAKLDCISKVLDEHKNKISNKIKEVSKADETVKNAYRFNIIPRNQLPIRFMNTVIDESELTKRFVDKTFGAYHVLEFAGYELKEIVEGRKTGGNEYINYIFKCQCERCGSIRYLTNQGLMSAQKKKSVCRNCWRIPDGDLRLIQWDR